MTSADRMLDRWLNDLEPFESVSSLAREIDVRCRIETFLYTDRLRIVFPDGSVIIFTNGTLKKG